MPLARNNNLRFASWMLVIPLLLFWGEGVLAGFGQDQELMGEGSHMAMGDDQHCQMPNLAVVQCDCDNGCFNLQLALPQRDSALLDFEHIGQPVLLSMDLADLLPIRGPPRDEILFAFKSPPVSIPPRLSFCCLRI